MKIELKRTLLSDTFTLGELYLNGKLFCYTVEDKVRDINNDGDLDDIGETKVYGETAIPKGTYKVILSMSNRFKKVLPEILNVKGFTGIRIHNGNGAIDSHGCIIIGMNKTKTGVSESRIALTKLMNILTKEKEISITIL
jgi:hypothetical protein